MKAILATIKRDTFIEVISDCYNELRDGGVTVSTESLKTELVYLCYHFLLRYNVSSEEVQMFNELLNDKDIDTLKNVNSYNYHKLIIHRKQNP